MPGIFISFEGIDGAGKSTHIESLAQAFRALGRSVVTTREPGGTPVAEQVRELLLYHAMDNLTEALLAFAARRDHVQTVIAPALAQHKVVLSDRFTDATFAYQGGGGGLDMTVLEQLERMVQSSHGAVLQPDLTILFDVDPVVAAQRLQGARLPDKFEAQPVAYFEKVRAAYLQRMEQDAARFVCLDAALPPDQVASNLRTALQQKGWLPC
jgi:dTMP kinase